MGCFQKGWETREMLERTRRLPAVSAEAAMQPRHLKSVAKEVEEEEPLASQAHLKMR